MPNNNPTGIGGVKKGDPSRNPSGGRPLSDMERKAREMRGNCQPELVEFFLSVVRDITKDIKDRLVAGKALLDDRLKVEVTGADGKPLPPPTIRLTLASDDELETIHRLAERSRAPEPSGD